MKLITLNTWGGRIYEPFIHFLKSHSRDTDIFCFQEVLDNPPGEISKVKPTVRQDINRDIKRILADFYGWMAPMQDHEESPAMYVRKTITLTKAGEVFVYRWKNAMVGDDVSTYGINIQYAQFNYHGKPFTVGNIHGHWSPSYKGDNPARLEQSQNVRKFLDGTEGAKILCGDFNLAPDTESMRILEKGMKNLVKEYGVASTRSHFYTKAVKFADYILVSPEVEVKDFMVLQDVVSDHLPLFLEFE